MQNMTEESKVHLHETPFLWYKKFWIGIRQEQTSIVSCSMDDCSELTLAGSWCPSSDFFTRPLQQDRGRKYERKVHRSRWWKGDHSPIIITGKIDSAWGKIFNLLPFPTGTGGYGLGDCGQSITSPLCCSFHLTFFPCSSVDPSRGLQSFTINLLQPGHSTICSSFAKYPPAPAWGPPWLRCGYIHHRGLSMGCIELPAPSWCFEGLQGVLAGPPPPLLPLSPRGSQGCSSHFSPHPLLPGSVLPFLTQTPPSRHHSGWGAGAIGEGWNRPCPARGRPLPTPHRGTPHRTLRATGHTHPVQLSCNYVILLDVE